MKKCHPTRERWNDVLKSFSKPVCDESLLQMFMTPKNEIVDWINHCFHSMEWKTHHFKQW